MARNAMDWLGELMDAAVNDHVGVGGIKDSEQLEALHSDILATLISREARVRGLGPVPLALSSGADEHPAPKWVQALSHAVDARAGGSPLASGQLFGAFEHLQERLSNGLSSPGPEATRRDRGVFYTPSVVADFLTDLTLTPLTSRGRSADEISQLTVIDPAAGAGSFLVSALSFLGDAVRARDPGMSVTESRRLVATSCLFGVDRDPAAVAFMRSLLWLEVGDRSWDAAGLMSHTKVADSIASPLALWADWFPAVLGPRRGFDAVLSNPPWGALRPMRTEFDARIRRLAGGVEGIGPDTVMAEDLWEAHTSDVRVYRRLLAVSGEFSHQGVSPDSGSHGDPELYKFFAERAYQLVAANGRIGLVLPGAFHRAQGAAALRSLYLDHGQFDYVLEFLNRRRLFAIHPMFRFLLAVYQRGPSEGLRNLAFALMSIDEAREALSARRTVELGMAQLTRLSGRLRTIPDVRSDPELRLLLHLRGGHPSLTDVEPGTWNVSFRRELDMTNDAPAFLRVDSAMKAGFAALEDGTWRGGNGESYLPVYEGRMVHQYDPMAKGYVSGSGRSAVWEPLAPEEKRVQPQFLVSRDYALGRRGYDPRYRAGYCDVTGHANERTVLAALIPPGAVCGNKVPTCRFEPADPRLDLLWLAFANSFVVDWIIRRWVSTTLNLFFWSHLPMPRPGPDSELGQTLIDAAGQLSGVLVTRDGLAPMPGPLLDLEARGRLRAMIDGAVATCYGLDAAEFELILSDFPLVDRGQLGPRGVSIGATKRAALASQRRLLNSTSADEEDRGPLVRSEGVVPYIPREVAAHWLRFRDGRAVTPT